MLSVFPTILPNVWPLQCRIPRLNCSCYMKTAIFAAPAIFETSPVPLILLITANSGSLNFDSIIILLFSCLLYCMGLIAASV